MPPHFTNNVTARSMALLYHNGPMSMPLLKAVRPGMRTKDIHDWLRATAQGRILVKYQVKGRQRVRDTIWR